MENRTIDFIPTRQLRFDPENPRLPKSLKASKENLIQKILEWMLKDEAFLGLMLSIGEYGYFPGEPLLVVRIEDDLFEVVEGNRRLAAVTLLLNPDLAPAHFRKTVQLVVNEARQDNLKEIQELPCAVFPERKEILRYLGYRHVTGVKEWSALAKARYLEQLIPTTRPGNSQEKFRELAKAIGTRSNYVARLLAGLKLYDRIEENDFYHISDLNEETLTFSVLTSAVSYSNIAQFIGMAEPSDATQTGLKSDKLEELTRWLYEKIDGKYTRIGESRRLKFLSNVVGHAVALKHFREGATLDEANSLADLPIEEGTVELFRSAITDVHYKLSIAVNYLESAKELTEAEASKLNEIHNMVEAMQARVRTKLAQLAS